MTIQFNLPDTQFFLAYAQNTEYKLGVLIIF